MELGTITKRVYIEASPEVVYDVVSSPDYMVRWWVDTAEFDRTPGATGTVSWARGLGSVRAPILIVAAVPGVTFSFRWIAPPGSSVPDGVTLTPENSILVTFELVAEGTGTSLIVTEEAQRELGWEAAVLEQYFSAHGAGWDELLPKVVTLAVEVASS